MLSDNSVTIVGVTPASFGGIIGTAQPDFYIPLNYEPVMRERQKDSMLRNPFIFDLTTMARLKPGITRAQASAEFATLTSHRRRNIPSRNSQSAGYASDPLHRIASPFRLELPAHSLSSASALVCAGVQTCLSPSRINMGLRTMRRALNLAYAWGVIEKPVKVELAIGENQPDHVLSTDELTVYLENCPQSWQDARDHHPG
jgi:hypothetical protein